MEILDIFQKLAPFTYSKHNETFFGFSGMTGSDWIITSSFLILVGIFIWKSVDLTFLGGGKDKYRLKELEETLENSNISTIDNEIEQSQDDKLIHSWQNFTKSLVTQNDGSKHRVYDADFFFNKHSLLDKVGSNSYASVPSLLLSLGLLGTFIGLFYGLVQLNLDDADTLKESMRTLIHASGAKFASSIWGLGLSVVFGAIARRHEQKLEETLHKIQKKINQIVPLQLSEQSLVNTEQGLQNLQSSLQQQTAEQEKFSTQQLALMNRQVTSSETAYKALYEQLNAQMPYLQKLNHLEHLEKLNSLGWLEKLEKLDKLDLLDNLEKLDDLEDISDELLTTNEILQKQLNTLDDLAENIAEELQKTLSNSLLEAMRDALGNLEKNIGGSEEDTLQDSIKNISMPEVIKQDGEALSKVIKELIRILEKFEENSRLQNKQTRHLFINLRGQIEAQNKNNKTVTKGIGEAVGEAGTTISGKLQPITDAVTKLANLNQQLNTTVGNITQFNTATDNMKVSAINFNNGADKTLTANTKLSDSVGSFTKKLDDSTNKLSNLPTKMDEVITKSNDVVDKIDEISTNSENTHKVLAGTHSQLIATNAQSVKALEKSLQAYQEQTKDDVEKVIKEIKKSLEDHQIETQKGLEKALKAYLGYVNAYQDSANSNIKNTLATFDGQLANFATSLSSAVEELSGSIEGLNERLNSNKPSNNPNNTRRR